MMPRVGTPGISLHRHDPTMNKAFTRESRPRARRRRRRRRGRRCPRARRTTSRVAGYQRLRAELMTLLDDGAPEGRRDRVVGGQERRPLGERRLPLRQEAPARDRPPHPLPDQAARHRRGRRPVAPSRQRRRSSSARRCATRTTTARSGRSRIIGVDEAESARGEVSWISPIARALLKTRVGDEVRAGDAARPRDARGARGALSGAGARGPRGRGPRQGLTRATRSTADDALQRSHHFGKVKPVAHAQQQLQLGGLARRLAGPCRCG